jgi:hypothetical protein
VPVTVYDSDTDSETQPMMFYVVGSVNRVYIPAATR